MRLDAIGRARLRALAAFEDITAAELLAMLEAQQKAACIVATMFQTAN